MNTLKEVIEERKQDDKNGSASDLCVAVKDRARSLQLQFWNEEVEIFSWSHFIKAKYEQVGGSKQVTMDFTGHEITIQGQHLEGLLDNLADHRIRWLKEYPKAFRPSPMKGNEVHIKKITVKKREKDNATDHEKDAVPSS